MRQAFLYQYTLPIQSGLVLKDKILSTREGLLIRLTENGKEGWGEIAPLPTFSTESLPQAVEQTTSILTRWQKGEKIDVTQLYPSVAFGLSMAEYELDNQPGTSTSYRSVPLCVDSLPHTIEKLQGCALAKLKIGRTSPTQDGQTAANLLDLLPTLRLRLDANRAWNLAQAAEFAEQLSAAQRARIDFIEEPCQTPSDSLRFTAQYQIAIAWDESCRQAGFILEKSANVAALIIKPTLTGSVARCIEMIENAHRCSMQAVISSGLESSLGLSQLARFAQQFTPQTPPGLDTLNLMPYQLIRPFGTSSLPLLGLNSPFIRPLKR